MVVRDVEEEPDVVDDLPLASLDRQILPHNHHAVRPLTVARLVLEFRNVLGVESDVLEAPRLDDALLDVLGARSRLRLDLVLRWPLEWLPSRFVKPYRVAESPVHLECELVQIVSVGDGPLSANVCIGKVLCFHVARDYLLDDGTVDIEKIDLIGRLGGDGYSTIRDRFDLPKPTLKG